MQSSTMKESPNWLDIPHELMANILQRLGTIEILDSAMNVCTTWRRICKDPSMWKVIYVNNNLADYNKNSVFEMLTKHAVDLSCGELIDISIKCFGSDELLDYITQRSNKLKRLYVMGFYHITNSGLCRAVKRLPQLEELSFSSIGINAECIEAIAQNCSQLKSLEMFYYKFNDNDVLAIANNMHELRNLHLYDTEITNHGLQAILNGCPHLESLDVRECYKLNLDGILGKLCRERIKDFKHGLIIKEIDEKLSVSVFKYL